MPNAIAYLALFGWPLVVGVLFAKLPLRQALIWSIFGGYLLLPQKTAVDLPLLPAFDRDFAPSFMAALMCMSSGARRGGGALSWLPESHLARALILMFVVGPFVTTILNDFPIHAGGGVYLRGLSIYDAFSSAMQNAVLLAPFLLARRHLGDAESHVLLLRAFCAAGIAYSLPILIEVRLSPQLHTWIYGFFPHSFVQMMRDGGFRPVVFLQHGLWVGLFVAMTLLAALGLLKNHGNRKSAQFLGAAAWLTLILVLCKSMGPLVLALLGATVLLSFGPRLQMVFAAIVAGMVVFYPMLRGAGLVPTQTVVSLSARVSEARAGSLLYRLDNEDTLLAKANERPVFGWGGWGRARIYDPRTGRDLSVTDGRWIIVIGTAGWLGYVAEFGLLTIGLFLLAARRGGAAPPKATAALCVITAINLLDLLPNATLTPLTWLLAGSLLGFAESRQHATKVQTPPARAPMAQSGRAIAAKPHNAHLLQRSVAYDLHVGHRSDSPSVDEKGA